MNDPATLAERYGIEPGYHDVFGGWHPLPEMTLHKLVQAIAGSGNASVQALPAGKTQKDHERAFQGDGKRHWALAVQLYAVRSRRNWGMGDFTDLKTLVALAARHGAAAVGLNPLHALFPDNPENASPYGPNARLFLNPLYIDVEALPEFAATADLDADIAAARGGDLVDYTHVARAKLKALRAAFNRFSTQGSVERRADFETFRKEQGKALLCFACFEVLRALHAPKAWPQWPEPWRRPDAAALHRFREQHCDACEFQEFMQWNADRQLRDCQAAARAAGMPIGLYVDVAVGIDPHGADAWAQQDAVLTGISVGAPPDEFNPAGQDWGLAPINPGTIAQNDFATMRRLMRATMRHAGAIRLDHVMGLKRIFMIPHGMSPGEGAYVRYPFEQLLGVVAEESLRAGCVVIGEDLGTVPEGFRETLSHYGLWSYRVMLFERDQQGRFRPQESYPAEAVAAFNTHDLPTHHGWLTGHDLRVKHTIGVDPGETDDSRHWARQKLREALQEQNYAPDDFAAVASFLGATPSMLVCVAIEDILGVMDQINIPGTVTQHPNWRRKLPVALEDMEGVEELRRVAEAFASFGR